MFGLTAWARPLASSLVILMGVGVAPVVSGAVSHADIQAPTGVWRPAVALAATPQVEAGLEDTEPAAISCASGGNCSLVGHWQTRSGRQLEAIVATESAGVWGRQHWIAHFKGLNAAWTGTANAVSCGANGYCLAGGQYVDAKGRTIAAIAFEYANSWGRAMPLPDSTALNVAGYSSIQDVSCPTSSSCDVAGTYLDSDGSYQTFVSSEKNGVWAAAEELPGLTTLEGGLQLTPELGALSCDHTGDCSVGGSVINAGNVEAFVDSEAGGTWGDAIEVPGTAPTSGGESDAVLALSCTVGQDCTAVGRAADAAGDQGVAFVATEVDGTWQTATTPAGSASLAGTGDEFLSLVDCTSSNDCSATGTYQSSSGSGVVLATELDGVWSTVALTAAANVELYDGEALIEGLSCGAAGNCSAVGTYVRAGSPLVSQALLDVEIGGVWQPAIKFPGVTALNGGNVAGASTVSCTRANTCAAAGAFRESNGAFRTFVASEVPS